MNSRLTTIAIALLSAGIAIAAEPAEVFTGEWRALPVTRFGQKVERTSSVITEGLEDTPVSKSTRIKNRVASADPSLFEGRTVYGGLISSDTWADLWLTEVPYGVYSFTIGNNPQPEEHISNMGYNFKAAAWGRDNFYGITPLSIMGILNGSRHIQLDTQNWVEKSNIMHSSDEGTYSLICCTMAYDQTNDTFYGFRYKEDLSGLDWVKVNPETSDFEMIAAYRGNTVVLTLAATPDGQMYYIDTEGDLYTINKKTGRTSLVGNTGVEPAAYDQAMVYDNRSGSFLWAALSSEGSVLYSVNPETAETKQVTKFKNGEQFVALYITDSNALPEAPAAVGRAQLKYAADGALDGTITFTAPSKTFSGENLTGSLTLDVWLDGENLKGEEVTPGASVSIPVNLEEGNHYVNITTSNESGWSPMRYIYQYTGYDTPLAPGNPTMEFADNMNNVSWEQPARGVNNGYIDFDNLTYTVVRMPDNVEVASGLQTTSFSEPTPEALQSYYYKITAINNGHVSEVAETNRVLCGDAFPTPYYQSFEEEATFRDFFKAVDNDGNGNTWRYGYSGEVRIDFIKNEDNPVDADDWLILPKVSLNEGEKYRFSMLMKTFTKAYPEDFEILIGSNPDDLSSFRSIIKETGFTRIANEFDYYTCDFLVDASADYNLAIRYCSKFNDHSSLMMVRNVAIDLIGLAGAPAQVSGMTVTPDADDLLEANVAFKAPELNLVDEALTSITKISVLRDNEENPVHVFENVTPGEELSWTDTEVPNVGLHTYTVIPANEVGDGESCSVEQFIGIYTAPFNMDFRDKKLSEALWSTENNFDDDENGWYGWRWKEDANGERYFDLYYYLMKNRETNIWLFSPKFRLEENTVYTVNYSGYFPGKIFGGDMEWQIAYGQNPTSDAMETIEGIEDDSFVASDFETILVNQNAGRYHIGYGVTGTTIYDYFAGKLCNFSLTRRTSAFAPRNMTGYNGTADQTGALKATLEFNTPTTDYYNTALDASENLTVKIYQGKDATIPAFTTTAAPGQKVQWVDEKALHGFNYYRITCENSHGTGEALLDTIFVGRDKPEIIENLVLKAEPGNANVRLTWNKPSVGVNGGLVLDAETKYNIYHYDPTTQVLDLIAENVAEKTYLVEEGYNNAQQMFNYAVSAVNSEGEGTALASSIVLGKPYNLPFAESFANTAVSTQLWQAIPMVQGATSAGIDNPVAQSYNQCSGPQDNDGGCAYFYNGYQAEVLIGALLVSPKIHPANDSINELSFWAYHYKEPAEYENKGVVYVAVSADDAPAEFITSIEVGGAEEQGWIEHKVNLDQYKNANHLSFILMGMTPGWQDVLYVDNISVTADYSGVNAISENGSGKETMTFDLNGLRVLPGSRTTSGTIVIRDGKKVMIRK